jgi:prevent-host-death family protein
VRQVNIHEAKTHLSRLVEEAADGRDVVIARAGKPVAMLVAYRPERRRRRLGLFAGQAKIHDDFDALPDDIQRAFDGGSE